MKRFKVFNFSASSLIGHPPTIEIAFTSINLQSSFETSTVWITNSREGKNTIA